MSTYRPRYEIGADGERDDDLVILIDIIKADNLAKKDTFGLSDPYVKVTLFKGVAQQGEYKTVTIKKTLQPVWNVMIQARVRRQNIHESFLLFEVFDANKVTRDDFLGQVEVNTRNIHYFNQGALKKYLLRPRSTKSRVRGHIHLKLRSTENAPVTPNAVPVQPSPFSGSEDPLRDPANISVGSASSDELNWDMVNDAGHTEPLPPGWTSYTDSQGRTFYIDHTNQRTQWDRPGTVSLPDGWEERIDANGRTFYVDHVNHITQWDIPTEAVARSATDIEAMRQRAQELFLNTRHQISQEDVEPSAPSNGTAMLTRQSTVESSYSTSTVGAAGEAEEEPLPPGWTMSRTEGGRPFFIDHNSRVTTWEDPRTTDTSRETPNAPTSMAVKSQHTLGALPDGWEARQHADGRTFYINHVAKKTQWEDPRLAKLGGPAVEYNRDYQQKYNYFRSTLRKPDGLPNKIDIKVKRKDLFETSFQAIMSKTDPNIFKTRLWVDFDGERGLDYGGVSREWFYLLSKEMFNPYYGLFENSAADNYTLQINPLSGTLQDKHLEYFRFIGRIAGMAVYHGRLLDGFFIRPFYKMMLDKEITLQDMQSVDLEYFNSLKWIIENSLEEAYLELTFSVDEEILGETLTRDLKPDGRNLPVTDRNKHEYVQLVINHRFCERIKEQMRAFNRGLEELVPRQLLKIFDENELEMLLCGIQDIDVKDWQVNTNYKGDYGPNHPTIVNFWKAIYLMSNESRARLLQFVTGTSRVPMNGFKEMYGSNGKQPFTIENWGSIDKYPRSHTCFNRLDLPPYTSYEILTERLMTAVESCEGFEGVD